MIFRPLVTALYAIPAVTGGRIAVRAVALLVALGCGLTAMALGRGQKLRLPALALILTLGQPILFMHSFGEMTELPFALLLGLSGLAYQKKQFFLAAVFVATRGRAAKAARLRLDVLQLDGDQLLGGSTFLVVGDDDHGHA